MVSCAHLTPPLLLLVVAAAAATAAAATAAARTAAAAAAAGGGGGLMRTAVWAVWHAAIVFAVFVIRRRRVREHTLSSEKGM